MRGRMVGERCVSLLALARDRDAPLDVAAFTRVTIGFAHPMEAID